MNKRGTIVRRVAWISVISNIILMVGKIGFGWLGDSESVFADGIHSAADVFASVIVLLVLKLAEKPADKEHPYGHGKVEVIVSGLVGIILVLVSIYIVVDAIRGFFHPIASPSLLALWAALISYGLKHWLYKFSLKAAKNHT